MVISLFGDTRVRPGMEERESRMVAKMEPILRAMPGFISYKSYRADDGEEVAIIRFETREQLEAWVHEGVHGEAQAIANDYYESFWIQTAETYREYTWRDGVHEDGDLADLFRDG